MKPLLRSEELIGSHQTKRGRKGVLTKAAAGAKALPQERTLSEEKDGRRRCWASGWQPGHAKNLAWKVQRAGSEERFFQIHILKEVTPGANGNTDRNGGQVGKKKIRVAVERLGRKP